MKKFFEQYFKKGLPGGPNEQQGFSQGFIVSKRGQWDYPGLPTMIPNANGRTTMKGVYDTLLGIDDQGNSQIMYPGGEYQFSGNDVYEIPVKLMQPLLKQTGGASDTDYISVNPLSVFGATPGLYTQGYGRPTMDLTFGRRNIFPNLTKRSDLESISGSLTTSLPYQNNTGVGVQGSIKAIGNRWENLEDLVKANVEAELAAGYDPNMGPYATFIGSPQFTFGNVQPTASKIYKGNLRAGEWLAKAGPYGGVSYTPGRSAAEESASIPFGAKGNFNVGIGGGKTLGASGYFGVDPFGQSSGQYSESGLKGRTNYGFDIGLTLPFGSKQKRNISESFKNIFADNDEYVQTRPSFFQSGGLVKAQEGIEKEQDLPGMYAYADKKKRNKFANLLDQAKAFGKTVEGRIVDKENIYPDFSIKNVNQYVQDVKDYQKQAADYEKARRLVKEGTMSTESFLERYNKNNWAKFDQATRKSTPEEQAELEETWYGPTDEQGRRRWMSDPRNVAKVAQAVAVGAPLAAAAPIVAPAVGATLANPLVQAGLTGYGVYDAATNTLPEAYRDFSEGRYLEGLGNVGMAALDLAPIPIFGTNLVDEAGELGKYLTTQTPLKNAYKINPWAFKPNESNYYRQVSKEAIDDALSSKLIREKGEVVSPENYTKFQNQLEDLAGTKEYLNHEDKYRAMSNNSHGPMPYFQKGELFYGDKPLLKVREKGTPISERRTVKLDHLIESNYSPENFQNSYGYKMSLGNPDEVGSVGILKPDPTLRDLENFNLYKKDWLRGYKQINTPKQLSSSANIMRAGTDKLMDASRYEIKNPDYYSQLLDTYSSRILSPSNKKFYKSLIETVKKQNGVVTERQLNELDRLKTGNFDFGKKAYADGGSIEAELTPKEIQWYLDNGYNVDYIVNF